MLWLLLGLLALVDNARSKDLDTSEVCYEPDTKGGRGSSVLQRSVISLGMEAPSQKAHDAKVVAIIAIHEPKFLYLLNFLKQWQSCHDGLANMDLMPMFSSPAELQAFGSLAEGEIGSLDKWDSWHPRIAQAVPGGARPQSWKKLDGVAQLLDSREARDQRYEFALMFDSEVGLGSCSNFGSLLRRLRSRHAQRTWYGDFSAWPWDHGKVNMVSIPYIQNLSAKAVAQDARELEALRNATRNFTVFTWWNDLPFVHLGVARKMFKFWGDLLAESKLEPHSAPSAMQVSANMGLVSKVSQLQNAGTAFEHIIYQYYCVLHEGFSVVDLTSRLTQHRGISLGERYWELPEPDQQVFLRTVEPGWLRVRPDCALPMQQREPWHNEGVLLYFHMDRCGKWYDGSGTWAYGEESGEVPSGRGISDAELSTIKTVVQRSWCSIHHAEQTTYSGIWRQVLPHVNHALQGALFKDSDSWAIASEGDAYMFGVAQGDGMALMHGLFPGRRVMGFDSFKGLPKEDQQEGKIPGWEQGTFQAAFNPKALVERAGGPSMARIFPGFYNETLTSDLVAHEGLRPAFYVDIDCDLHVSSFAALDWLFANRVARVGTLIGYDDWWTIPCFKYHQGDKSSVSPLSVGEGLAHVEVARKYGVVFKCVAGPCAPPPSVGPECHRNNNWGPVFVVAALGAPKADHGFEFAPDQEHEWITTMKVCPTVGW